MRVAVIGAGWAGLAAAIDLTLAGQSVTVFEAGRVPGGRARSINIDGHTLDNGQHLLLGAYHQTLALIRTIGLDPQQVFKRSPLRVHNNAGFQLELPRWPAPFNLAWGLLRARGLTGRDKLKAARWMRTLQRTGFKLPQDMPVQDWLAQAEQTPSLCAALWDPLCLAALNTPTHLASAQRFANVLRDSLGSARTGDTDLLFTALPLGQVFAEPACAWLSQQGAEIRFSHRVQTLQPLENGIRVDTDVFDQAILATAPQHVQALCPTVAVPTEFEPITTVYLRYPPEVHLPSPLYGLQGGIGQWVIDRGQGWLAGIFSGRGEWATYNNDALCQTLVSELQLPPPITQHVVRSQRATFSCQPGYISPSQHTDHPRLWLAGDYTDPDYPATLEGAIRSGRRAAGMMRRSQ